MKTVIPYEAYGTLFYFSIFSSSRGRGSYRGRGRGNYYRQDRSVHHSHHHQQQQQQPHIPPHVPNDPYYNQAPMNQQSNMPSGGGYHEAAYHDMQPNRYEHIPKLNVNNLFFSRLFYTCYVIYIHMVYISCQVAVRMTKNILSMQ